MGLSTAERCLHDRGRLAFAAAASAGLPGEFRAFEVGGLLGLLTTSPGLEFLNSVSGGDEGSIDAVPEVLAAFTSAGAPSPVLIISQPTEGLDRQLRGMGLVPSGPRPLAVTEMGDRPEDRDRLQVTEVGTADELGLFLDVLAAGYAAPERVATFLMAEHTTGELRRFLAWREGEPVAAAAMSIHGDAAVLGGASTLPIARGSGAQATLLRHRRLEAADAGCVIATATAAPGSPSLRNLTRAGFTIWPRAGWRAPMAHDGVRRAPRRDRQNPSASGPA